MQPGSRLALELRPEQVQKMHSILRVRNAKVLHQELLQEGLELLIVEKG